MAFSLCVWTNADAIGMARGVHGVSAVTTMKMAWNRTMAEMQTADGLAAVVRDGFAGPGRSEGLAAWTVRVVPAWWASRAKGRPAPVRQMRLVETLSLGGRRQMMLVVCQGERFLVGCGADEVQTIVHVPGCGPVTAAGESCP